MGLIGQLTIYAQKAAAEDIEFQMIDNSMDLRNFQKYTNDEISQIHQEYNLEEQMIRDEIKTLDEDSREYDELMAELQEMKDEEDNKIRILEEKISEKETDVQVENDNLEARKQALDANVEATEEYVQEEIEEEFGYFQ